MSTAPLDRRRQILDVALTAFSNRGYHNTSMNDIADALSMTKPVVYQYFDSKRELYLELLHEVSEELVASVTEVLTASGEPRQQVERGIIAYFTWVSSNPEAFSLLFDSSERVDVEVDDIVSEFEDNAARAIAPFIAADISPEDQHTFAVGIVGMAETVSRQVMRDGRSFDPVALGTSVAELMWGGLRSIGQSRNTQPR
jgi:AcrR family transcriptional regulator